MYYLGTYLNIWYLELKFFSVQDILGFLTEDLYFWAIILFHILKIKSELNKFNHNSTFYFLLQQTETVEEPMDEEEAAKEEKEESDDEAAVEEEEEEKKPKTKKVSLPA